MQQRKIAFVGLETHSVQACLSMLGITASMVSVQWVQGSPESADVVMVAVECRDQAPAGKPRIVVYRADQNRPGDRYSLSQPFRAMPLASLLEDICRTHFAASDPHQSGPDRDEFKLWQALAHAMTASSAEPGVFPLQADAGTFFIEPQSRSFFVEPPLLARLAAGAVQLSKLEGRAGTAPAGLLQRPAFLLGWHLAGRCPALLPWLDPQAHFRLCRWPSFGPAFGTPGGGDAAVPKSRELLMLCALMSKTPQPYAQLLSAIGGNRPALDRFLNACAMGGLLQADETSAFGTGTTRPGRFGGLIRGLRQRLGLKN